MYTWEFRSSVGSWVALRFIVANWCRALFGRRGSSLSGSVVVLVPLSLLLQVELLSRVDSQLTKNSTSRSSYVFYMLPTQPVWL